MIQESIEYCPVIRPSAEQFKDFAKFVEFLDSSYKSRYGMVKIVPPEGWAPTSQSYESYLQNLTIKTPIQQNAEGKTGFYEFKHVPLKSIPYTEYKKQYQPRESMTSTKKSIEEIQQLFWKTLVFSPAVYGADLIGTMMDETAGSWNLNSLNTFLESAFQQKVPGVNRSYCYVGSWKSTFCWHKEDLDLSAINYLHFGKSKFWYCIRSQDGVFLEKFAKKRLPLHFQTCKEYLRHKTILINPRDLIKQFPNMHIAKTEQKQGQFIIAFGGAYHCGFNTGLNVAEAVNFATNDWLRQLPYTQNCICRGSSVKACHEEILRNLEAIPNIVTLPVFEEYKKITQKKLEYIEKQMEVYQGEKLQNELSRKFKKIKKSEKQKTKERGKGFGRRNKICIGNKVYQVNQSVQCDTCLIWRQIPEGMDSTSFGEKFHCSELNKKCFDQELEDEEGITINQKL